MPCKNETPFFVGLGTPEAEEDFLLLLLFIEMVSLIEVMSSCQKVAGAGELSIHWTLSAWLLRSISGCRALAWKVSEGNEPMVSCLGWSVWGNFQAICKFIETYGWWTKLLGNNDKFIWEILYISQKGWFYQVAKVVLSFLHGAGTIFFYINLWLCHYTH